MTPKTLRKERRLKFEAILSTLGKLTQAEVEATAELLADAAESRTEKLSKQDLESVNKKVDAIIGLAQESQTRIEAGTGWRGRELLPPDYTFYGDLWHRLTGLEMYGAKAKAKIDTEWLKAFKDCFENEVSESAFCEAYIRETWDGRRAVGKPSMIVATAKAIQAANKKVESVQQGQGFYA